MSLSLMLALEAGKNSMSSGGSSKWFQRCKQKVYAKSFHTKSYIVKIDGVHAKSTYIILRKSFIS
jgi:hypothetical protein